MRIGSKVDIIGLFYYNGSEIIAEDNLIIHGQFSFELVKELIFEATTENYPLFDKLSEILSLEKWYAVKLECVVRENESGKYYDIYNVYIIHSKYFLTN